MKGINCKIRNRFCRTRHGDWSISIKEGVIEMQEQVGEASKQSQDNSNDDHGDDMRGMGLVAQ